jgi:acyl transferase domain-containing protein
VIVEEAPAVNGSYESRPWQLLVLSARSGEALENATSNLLDYLKRREDHHLADIAYTLQVGRRSFNHRRTVICLSVDDAVAALEARDPKRVVTHLQELDNPPVTFLFPGLGDHYVNMAQGLYDVEPAFRDSIDRCCELLKPLLGTDLRDVLYPGGKDVAEGNGNQRPLYTREGQKLDLRKMLGRAKDRADEPDNRLNHTCLTQPALFVIEYALAQLWIEKGVLPQAMIGYSIGEYVAACLAGVLTLEESLLLVARRSELIEGLRSGAMLAVPMPEQEVLPLLGEELSLAAVNGPGLCVVSGPAEAVTNLEKELTERNVVCRQLQTSHAFHSRMMEPIIEQFLELFKSVELKPPKIPYISNLTGKWISAKQATDPHYWAEHMCQAVRFAQGLDELLRNPAQVLLEVGPGHTLSTFVMQHPAKAPGLVVASSVPQSYDRQPDYAFFLQAVTKLWHAGVEVDWDALYSGEKRCRVALPTYPFERRRYWVDGRKKSSSIKGEHEPYGKNPDRAKWFYAPAWKHSIVPSFKFDVAENQTHRWLVFADEGCIGSTVARRLKEKGQDVITVMRAGGFQRVVENSYTIDPQEPNDYQSMFRELGESGKIPTRIAHLWGATRIDEAECCARNIEDYAQSSFYSLLYLAQAIGGENISEHIELSIITSGLQEVTGEERLQPHKALALGPCRVIPQEYPNIVCRSIDVSDTPEGSGNDNDLADKLISEMTIRSDDQFIAYRRKHRWVQNYESVKIEGNSEQAPQLRKGGVYVITGGLGGLGLSIAQYFARTARARLVLVGRTPIPGRENWGEVLSREQKESALRGKITQLQELESLGAEVLVAQADVADADQTRSVVTQTLERFGQINGVVHAAGVAGAGLIQLKSHDMAASVLAPKVKGTLALAEALGDAPLDFFIMFSSLASITGGFGQIDYCAANAFLDAFARYNLSKRGILTIAINWGAWQWDSWQESFATFDPDLQMRLKATRESNGITSEEGVEAFNRVVSSGLPQVVVSPLNLKAVIEHHDVFTATNLLAKLQEARPSKSAHPRPLLATAYIAPRDEIERGIADVWRDLLGIEEVGIYDNFFELGGHSLLAIQLVSRLRDSYKAKLGLPDLFEAATVAELAKIIRDAGEAPSRNAGKIADLVRLVEQMSEEEALRLVSEGRSLPMGKSK